MKYSEKQYRDYIHYLLSFKQFVIVNNASDLLDYLHESMTKEEEVELIDSLNLEHVEVQDVNDEKVKTFGEFIRRENNLNILLDD